MALLVLALYPGKTAPVTKRPASMPEATVRHGLLQEIFNLEEGSVTLTYPASLSAESYQDLSDYLELFLRKAKRRAEKGDDDKSYLE
jgi:hypothetical protein